MIVSRVSLSLCFCRWVVTAAHCIDAGMTIKLGINDNGKFGQVVKVRKKFIHPGYYKDKNYNDIGELLSIQMKKNLTILVVNSVNSHKQDSIE